MFSNTEFNHLKLKLDQLYLSLSGGKVNGETVFSKKVTFGSGDKAIKIYDGKIEGLDSPGGHTYDLELDGTQLTLTEDSEDKTTVQIPSTVVGACTTAAATAAKVVTLTDVTDFELTKGTVIVVKFTNTNTAQNPTLNVNGTGAKSVYYNTSVVTTGSLSAAGEANRYISYMYDGTYWIWMGHSIDHNTTYSAMSKSELTTGTATTSRVVRADYLNAGIRNIAYPPTAPIEASATSVHPYDVGDYFIYNGILYRCTVAITSGGTITPGTNCEATNVASELTSLNSDLSVQDISSNLSCPRGTFTIKQAHVILNSLVVIAFEIKTTASLNTAGTIISGFPKAKGNYINVVFNAGGNARGGYTDNQSLVLGNGSIPSGTQVAGNFSYMKA